MSLKINKQIDIFKKSEKIIETHILKKLLMYSQIKTSSQSPKSSNYSSQITFTH